VEFLLSVSLILDKNVFSIILDYQILGARALSTEVTATNYRFVLLRLEALKDEGVY